MNAPLEIVIISNSPVYATSLCCLLERRPEEFRCRTPAVGASAALEGVGGHPLLLVAPLHWREMAAWLPGLKRHCRGRACLLLADLRIAGLFWPAMEDHLCTVVPPAAPPERLRASLWVLAEGHALCRLPSLLDRFACGAPGPRTGERLATPKELQCACAVSLGLTNPQIAALLHLSEGTVKTHLNHLMRKLRLSTREELADYVAGTLAPTSAPDG